MTPAIGASFAGVTFPFRDTRAEPPEAIPVAPLRQLPTRFPLLNSYARGRDIATFTWDFEKALGARYFFAQPLKVRALLDIMFPR